MVGVIVRGASGRAGERARSLLLVVTIATGVLSACVGSAEVTSEPAGDNTLVETTAYTGIIISENGASEFRYLFDDGSNGFWEPSRADVASAEECIGRFLGSAQQDPTLDMYQKESAAFISENLDQYRRQYVGVVVGGERRIWCNLFFSDGSFLDWERVPVDVDGGGNRYWQIYYIVPDDECVGFSVHGQS